MSPLAADLTRIGVTGVLVLVNAFFVAAEFAMVKIRPSQVDVLVREGRPFAKTLRWLVQRLDASLSACQLGITMASLGLGWIGEPAIAHLIHPLLHDIGIHSDKALHITSFIIAFSIITAAHLVIGEQAPKIMAIRRPEVLGLWCALPMKAFYFSCYPFLIALNKASSFILARFGIEGGSEHEAHHSEEEIRLLLEQSRIQGGLTRSEHQLLNAVFEFDDLLAGQVMVPRGDISYLDLDKPLPENLERARKAQHTRYPLCHGSLDDLVGIIHIKDLFAAEIGSSEELERLARPPHRIPQSMAVHKLLRHFQVTRQHFAFVVDEHGTTVGMITLENVLEQIVGSVEDEFDMEPRQIVPDGKLSYIILGNAPVDQVERELGIDLGEHESHTLSGVLVERLGRLPVVGDRVTWRGGEAEVTEMRAARAEKIRVTLKEELETDLDTENEEDA